MCIRDSEWVMERQAVTTDKDSGIVNDANLWATETMGNAKYPLELFPASHHGEPGNDEARERATAAGGCGGFEVGGDDRVIRSMAMKKFVPQSALAGSTSPLVVLSHLSDELGNEEVVEVDNEEVVEVDQENVRVRAYFRWLSRRTDGSDALSDWLAAEREEMAEKAAAVGDGQSPSSDQAEPTRFRTPTCQKCRRPVAQFSVGKDFRRKGLCFFESRCHGEAERFEYWPVSSNVASFTPAHAFPAEHPPAETILHQAPEQERDPMTIQDLSLIHI